MANRFLTMKEIAAEALATLYNTTIWAPLVYRGYDQEFVRKPGEVFTVRKPAVFQALDFDRGAGITVQDAVESSFDVRMGPIRDVSFAVTSEDLALKIADFRQRLLVPAMEAMVQRVDGDIAAAVLAAATGGGDPKSGLTIEADDDTVTLAAHGFRNGDPIVFPTLTGGTGLTAGTKYFVRDATENSFKVAATLGGAAINVTADATAGTVADAPGGTVTIDASQGASTATINARTVLTKNLAPQSGRLAVLSPDGSGKLLKDPLMRDADKRGDTDGLIDAAIGRKFGVDHYESQVYSGLASNVAFHRDAVALVSGRLEEPLEAKGAAIESYKGLALRVVKDYDITKKQDVISVDFMYGIKAIRPSWAVKVDLT